MFYDLSKKHKRLVFVLLTVFVYLGITILIIVPDLINSDKSLEVIIRNIPKAWPLKLLGGFFIAFISVYLFNNSLDIKAASVGDGQHGAARFASEEEKRKAGVLVPFGEEKKPGFVIEVNHEKGYWIVDTSDQTALVLAPPGGGKTTCLYLPTIYYNGQVIRNTGTGASMILTDNKGDLYLKTKIYLEQCGVDTKNLDFRFPMSSLQYNLMHNTNQHMDVYLNSPRENDRLKAYAKAESYAKILADTVVNNMDANEKSESSAYFTNAAKGLMTALILLVSEYGNEGQRHLLSVFRLIIELNGLLEGSDVQEGLQKNKMEELLKTVDNHRLINYSGAAIKADVRTTMNVFSSALEKMSSFIDAELEQMICSHSQVLDAESFIGRPTAIFLVCPDENTTRHFFASLFIRMFSNEMIELAAKYYHNVLPVTVLNLWDEFGNMPPIKDIDVLLSAIRSRNIRFMLSLQSLKQLEKNYTRTKAELIRDTCQITIFSFMASSSLSTSKELSEILGKETVMTGSVSNGRSRSSTKQMTGKPLMFPDEIITMPFGNWIVMKSGAHPMKTKLPRYAEYLPEFKEYTQRKENAIYTIACLTADIVALNAIRLQRKQKNQIFTDEVI